MHALTLLQPVGYERPMPVADGVEVEFINAGHLLGSAYARIRTGGQTILFGGDLGRFGRPALPDPTLASHADYLLVESTYGNRVHAEDSDGEKLAQAIRDTFERRGRVIIPAFAVGRVEELLWWIKKLEAEKRIPVLPVFVDSPMASKALASYSAASTSSIRICTPNSRTRRRRSARPPTSHANGVAPRRQRDAISAPSAPRSSAPSRRLRSRRS